MFIKIMGYYLARLISKILKKHELLIEYYRKFGKAAIGKNCLICSPIMTRESELIEIGDNVTVSSNVKFVTHDNSIKYVCPEKSDLFGKISIGNNCFIGENSILLYGISIPDNTIIAAGSVVTKSIKDQFQIIGGNPAKIIGDWKTYKEKYQDKAICRSELEQKLKVDDSFLVKRGLL